MVRKILARENKTEKRPFIIRLEAQEAENPYVLSQLSRLQAYLCMGDDESTNSKLDDEFSTLGLVERGWRDLRVLDNIGQEIKLPHFSVNDATPSQLTNTSILPPAPSASHGSLVAYPRERAKGMVRDFWSHVLTRGMTGMENVIAASRSFEPDPVDKVNEAQIIRRKDARRQVKTYYSNVLKRALDRLQNSIGQETVADSTH